MRRAAFLGAVLAMAGCPPPVERTRDDEALERYALAEDLFARSLYREAIPHYEFVVSARDLIREAWIRLSACREALGEEGEALAVLERARRVHRTDEGVLRRLARLYERRGALEEAAGVWRELLRACPGDAAVRAEVARLEGLKGAK